MQFYLTYILRYKIHKKMESQIQAHIIPTGAIIITNANIPCPIMYTSFNEFVIINTLHFNENNIINDFVKDSISFFSYLDIYHKLSEQEKNHIFDTSPSWIKTKPFMGLSISLREQLFEIHSIKDSYHLEYHDNQDNIEKHERNKEITYMDKIENEDYYENIIDTIVDYLTDVKEPIYTYDYMCKLNYYHGKYDMDMTDALERIFFHDLVCNPNNKERFLKYHSLSNKATKDCFYSMITYGECYNILKILVDLYHKHNRVNTLISLFDGDDFKISIEKILHHDFSDIPHDRFADNYHY